MSFTDDFLKELEKKKKKIDNTEVKSPYSGGNKTSQSSSSGDDFTKSFLEELGKAAEREKKRQQLRNDDDIAPVTSTTKKEDDVAPIGTFRRDKSGELKEYSDLFSPSETVSESRGGGRGGSFAKEDVKEKKTSKSKKRTWFEKSGALDDGFQLFNPKTGTSDIQTIVLSTGKDLIQEIGEGILEVPEKMIDTAAYIVGGAGKLFGADNFADKAEKFIAKDLYDSEAYIKKQEKFQQPYIDFWIPSLRGVDTEEASVLGEKSEGVANAAGQLLVQILAGQAGVPWYATTGTTSFGGEVENAFQQGASYEEAGISAAITAGAEILTEKLVGGSGLGEKGLINVGEVTKGISNKGVKVLADYGIDVLSEGGEEVASQFFSTLGQQLTYEKEETWAEILSDEEKAEDYLRQVADSLFGEEARDAYGEAFVGGAALGGGMNAGKVTSSIKNGTDYRTGLTANEESVVNKEVEKRIAEAEKDGKKLTNKEKAAIEEKVMNDLDKGYISTDTIEEVLGGETYKSYQDTVAKEDSALKPILDEAKSVNDEFKSLNQMKKGDMTGEQTDRLEELRARKAELEEQIKNTKKASERDFLQRQYKSEAYEIARGSRLEESYRERARKGQKYEADTSQYEGIAKESIQSIIDKGQINNTNKAHEVIDFAVKSAAARGKKVTTTTTAEILAKAEQKHGKDYVRDNFFKQVTDENGNKKWVLSKIPNAEIDGDTIALNVNSPNLTQGVIGHEIGHTFEGTKYYGELAELLNSYDKSIKGEEAYTARKNATDTKYQNIAGANSQYELNADLLGEYIFSDEGFVQHLTQNRNVFQKVFDQIKYMLKYATAGSQQERDLLRIKHTFEKAWRSAEKASAENSDVKYSIERTKSMSWADQIDGTLYNGNNIRRNDTLVVGNLSETIKSDGISDKPLAVPVRVVTKATSGKDMTHSIKKGKIAKLDAGIQEAPIVAVNPERNALIYVTNVKQGGLPIVVTFDMDATFDGDDVHQATSIHLQTDTMSLLRSLPKNATIYVQKKGELEAVGATNNLRGLAANIKFTEGIISQEGDVVNSKFSLSSDSEGGDFGYHAGDLGKAEGYWNMVSSNRGTGHFGTGTYFVGNETEISDSTYGNRPHEKVDFSNYKMFKPLGENEGFELHSALKYINDNISQYPIARMSFEEVYDIRKKADDAEYDLYFRDDATEAEKVEAQRTLDSLKEQFESIGYDPNTWDSEKLYSELKEIRDDYRSAVTHLSGIFSYRQDNGRLSVDDTRAKIDSILQNVYDEVSHIEDAYAARYEDSPSTRFMKAMGYEGIDVRGMKGLDNTKYGSVIYDLKGADLARKNEIGTAKYSLSDNQGRELTKEQSEFFKDSKIKDENGNLLVMYHGTPNGEFTVFKDGTYFTANKEYADKYQNPGASSLNSRKVASSPKTFEVYLNITKPFDINDAEARNIYINDYIKGGNAVGINPYLSDAEYSKIDSIDWTEGEDLREFLVDNGYDYDGLVLDEGAVGGYGEAVEYRGTSYVVFSPEQVKNVDNANPTSDPDIRFSLSEAVEETPDLIAAHNLTSDKLLKSLKLGGLPMPSIAITKADSVHNEYGDISLILRKDAIDPKANKENKIYSGDAWTPVYPTIEFKPNVEVVSKISEKYYELAHKYGYDDLRPMYRFVNDTEDALKRDKGEQGMLKELYENTGMMQVYLLDSGKGKVDTIQKEVRSELSDAEVEMNEYFIKELGADIVDDVMSKGDISPMKHRVKYWETYGDKIKEVYKKFLSEEYGFSQEEIDNVLSGMKTFDYLRFVRDAHLYRINGRVTTRIEADNSATQEAIRQKAAEGYKEWIDGLFKGIEEKTGIRNNRDYFTPSGNRRSWDTLHWENTLENVVRVMKEQGNGENTFFTGHGIWGAAANEYKSIEEVKADSDRLKSLPKEEYEEIRGNIGTRLQDVAQRIMSKSESNQFIAADNALACIVDAVRHSRTEAGIFKELKQYSQLNVTEADASEIVSIVADIAKMPTEYFESKPRRAVGFDEVGVFVIPNNADAKLKQELLNRGYSIAEYDPNIEGDRQKVVNSFEQYKFSLSNVGEAPVGQGTPLSDLGLNTLTEDVYDPFDAPVQEEVAPIEATEGPMTERAEVLPDDYAPMSEDEVAMIENEALDSITDEDAPPEIEMPHYEQRDTGTIDNKSLKGISERASEYLGLNRTERATLEGIIQNYSQNENLTRDDLYSEMKDKFSVIEDTMPNEDAIQIKKDLKAMKLYVSDEVKADFGKGVEDGYTKFLRSNFGRLRIVKDIAQGVPVDSAYMELSDLYPSYFPDDIINPADQLRKIAEIASMSSEEILPMELSDAEIEAVADMVYTDISDYMNEARLNAAESIYAPHSDIDAPIIETEVEAETENKVLSVREMYEQKKNNYKETLAAYEAGKEKSLANFQEAIGKKLNEYNALKNKNTKRANTLLQQIENLRLRRDNVQADYANRIAKQQVKIEAFESKDFSEFENKVLAMRRRDLHKQIVDNTKAQFEAQGYDLDEVLKHAKDLSTFATVDNTPQRVIEKSLGWKEGHILSDITVNKVAQNETEGIKWLNTITDKKNGLLAQLVKDYGIKPGSKESAAAQMYAEGFYVNNDNEVIKYGDAELSKDFPDGKVRENIKRLSKDQRIRQFYDDTLKAINESRARNAYPEIQKLDNYFLHFRAMEDTFSRLGLPFNPNDIRAKDLPTDLNGVTADLKPGQPYFASARHRMGQRTSFDLLGGLEKYATSAKNQIYHIDDIQTLRAIRNYVADTYGQAKGLENLDSLSEEEVQERIKDVYGSHLSTFAKFLNEEANVLAGKTALIDRGLEGVIGRRAMTFMDTVNRQVGSNMIGYNVSSALTNLIAPVQAFAKTNKADFIKGFAQTVADKVKSIHGKSDGFSEASPVVIRRKGSDRFHRTAWQKLSDPGYALMGAVDNFSTELIARAKYNELTRKGMDSETAHVETDKWVSRLMGDRSLGQMPQLYNSKMLGLVTKFQLEVRNQLDSQFYDTIKEANASTKDIQNGLHRNAKKAAKIASTFFTLAVGQHLFGKAFEAVAGYNPAFDIISVLIKALGFDDDEDSEDTVLDNIEQGFFELMGDMPYTSILEGGRIPISSALPIEELYKGEDQYGNEKSRWKTILEALPYYTMPGGYGQFKKTTQGLGMFDDDLPISGSYTDSGKLRFPVEDTPWNRVQAGLFGQYASENSRDYFDNERKALDEKQIQEFIDSGISIQEYWEYREGLSGLKSLEEKAEYIYGLDIPTETKNLFINNLSGRKEDIDLSGMGEYDSFKEYDFATKNPEKYAFLKEHNISVSEYENFDDDTKEAYTWAFNNPEKYTVSKAIASDLMTYRGYTKELYDIKADKDSDGKSISGSRKEKVIDYINNMDADYGQKIILFKTEYPADDTYNNDIIEYLNDREDISYEDMVTILKELGFTVKGNNVYWD